MNKPKKDYESDDLNIKHDMQDFLGDDIKVEEDKNTTLIEYNGEVDSKHFLLNIHEISEIKKNTVFGDTVFCMKNGNCYFTSTPYNVVKEELSKCGFIIKGLK